MSSPNRSRRPSPRRWLSRRLQRLRAPRGRVLAVKWGVNPNSSSLGADVTFLLFGAIAVALLTPLVALALRARGWLGAAVQQSAAGGATEQDPDQ